MLFMLVFGQMHLLTLFFLLAELMALPFVLWYYYVWPQDKTRLWYFVLLVLLIFYNLTGGLFPDPGITLISIPVQNIIAYGSGFLMATFFPYYFYKSFHLEALRVHALYGAPLLLMLPYVAFFVVIYPVTGNLNFALEYGMIIPFIYSPVLLWVILKSIREKFKSNELSLYPYRKSEMQAVYWAVTPWICMSVFTYLQVAQWIEVLVTNTGFIIVTTLFMLRSGKIERMEKERSIANYELQERQKLDFQENCQRYKLSNRECQVGELLCQGLTYKQIAESLYISEKTVDTHVQNIFLKTGVNKKIDLQKILGFGGKRRRSR